MIVVVVVIKNKKYYGTSENYQKGKLAAMVQLADPLSLVVSLYDASM
jgi:hypothetical protein